MFKSKSITPAMGCLAGLALILAFVVIIGAYWVSTFNTQQRLKNQYDAKVAANQTELSNLKSKLPEAASVTNAQMEKLQELFVAQAEARTSDGGALMKWVQESVPNIDQATFLNLQNIITSTRDSWTTRQVELVDISREFNTNLDTQPKGMILGFHGFEKLKPNIVITEGTAKAFETGRDEALDLF